MRKRKGFEGVPVALGVIVMCCVGVGLAVFWMLFQEIFNSPATVSLYDNNGNVIQQWSGISHFRVSDSNVCFETDGHRIIVHGGIVIAE